MTIFLCILGGLIVGAAAGAEWGIAWQRQRNDKEVKDVAKAAAGLSLEADRRISEIRRETALQISVAFEQSGKVLQECRAAISECRGMLKDANEIAKLAANTLFGNSLEPAAAPDKPLSVADADRQRVREQREDRKG